MLSEEFQRFFDRSTRLVERALWEEPNLFVDYTGGYDGENGDGGDGDKAGIKLSLNRYFYDERWTKNRVVTSMDWSVRFFVKSISTYNIGCYNYIFCMYTPILFYKERSISNVFETRQFLRKIKQQTSYLLKK